MPVSDEVLFKAVWDKMYDKSPEEIAQIYGQLKVQINGVDRKINQIKCTESDNTVSAPVDMLKSAVASPTDTASVPTAYTKYTADDLIFDPKEAITDDEIICCLCGKGMGILTKHLNAAHKISPEMYIELCGYPRGQKLMSRRAAETALERGSKLRKYDFSDLKHDATPDEAPFSQPENAEEQF